VQVGVPHEAPEASYRNYGLVCLTLRPFNNLLHVKTELQSWLGKKYCDEAELLALLLAHSIVRRVRTIKVEIRPLGGDSFKVALEAKRPLVSEAKAEIARTQRTREAKQELYKVATRADGGAVREDDAEPELLDDENMELRNGEIVAMAVKEGVFDPLHAQEERTLIGHNSCVSSLVMHGDKLITVLATARSKYGALTPGHASAPSKAMMML
jgi:hypothetical protein